MNTEIIKRLAHDKYVWPGGYEIFFVTHDGAMLCSDCVNKEIERIVESTTEYNNDGWWIDGYDYSANMEEPDTCDHCNKWILPSGMSDEEFNLWRTQP